MRASSLLPSKPRRELAAVASVAVLLSACAPLAQMCKGDPAWRVIQRSPKDVGLTGERVVFTSRDHLQVSAWWMPSPSAKRSIVLVHGHGGNRSDMLPLAARFGTEDNNLLAIDMRASGESQGDYPSGGHLEAAEVLAAVDWLHARGAKEPVILFGHSMGAVAVLHAAAEAPPGTVGAVVSDGAFVDPFEMLDRIGRRLAKDPSASAGEKIGLWFASLPIMAPLIAWATLRETGFELDPRRDRLQPVLAKIRAPLLVLSGEKDDISPPEDALKIFRGVDSSTKQLCVFPGASHELSEFAPSDYDRLVEEFFAALRADQPRDSAISKSERAPGGNSE